MANPQPPRRRSGGRSARVASRAAPIAAGERPVWPGIPGGQYSPLTDDEVRRKVRAVLAQENHMIAPALHDRLAARFDLVPLKHAHTGE